MKYYSVLRLALFLEVTNNQIFMLDICTFNLGDYIFSAISIILLLLSLVAQVTKVIILSSKSTFTPVLYNSRLIESDIKALKALFESQFDCVNSKESSRLFRFLYFILLNK